ncbi:hypothetical protein DL766_009455 [Monosporascus sp. MC13-8B]|uniref:Uncharacterized protein n=1 Tax=Monosporascus cannonballus TaxID=155416 RepID=A0ABY0HC68_9PEZI|nr:hypothetical protein DL762_004367 [Monosporascus cannonballus]RYO91036.1 hypothetical protein DL763_005114 [Monosporascus cannonballus]RYP15244.1 hypothetical protein DL766_009455 [Monosporascus sp. MC13-8B]
MDSLNTPGRDVAQQSATNNEGVVPSPDYADQLTGSSFNPFPPTGLGGFMPPEGGWNRWRRQQNAEREAAQESTGDSRHQVPSHSPLPDYQSTRPDSNPSNLSTTKSPELFVPSPTPGSALPSFFQDKADRYNSPTTPSTLPSFFKDKADRYYIDEYRQPTPFPTTPIKYDISHYRTMGQPFQYPPTPPLPQAKTIDDVPNKLTIDVEYTDACYGVSPATSPRRSIHVPGGDILRKRKEKPRVFEYEPGWAGRYIAGIKDTEQRRATMRAFMHSIHPPGQDWLRCEDDSDYEEEEETEETAQSTELRQPKVSDPGIPDKDTLLRVLAFRAEYNLYDKNTTVRPGSTKRFSESGPPVERILFDRAPAVAAAAAASSSLDDSLDPAVKACVAEKHTDKQVASVERESRHPDPWTSDSNDGAKISIPDVSSSDSEERREFPIPDNRLSNSEDDRGPAVRACAAERQRTFEQSPSDHDGIGPAAGARPTGKRTNEQYVSDDTSELSSPPPPPTNVKRIKLTSSSRAASSTVAAKSATAAAATAAATTQNYPAYYHRPPTPFPRAIPTTASATASGTLAASPVEPKNKRKHADMSRGIAAWKGKGVGLKPKRRRGGRKSKSKKARKNDPDADYSDGSDADVLSEDEVAVKRQKKLKREKQEKPKKLLGPYAARRPTVGLQVD